MANQFTGLPIQFFHFLYIIFFMTFKAFKAIDFTSCRNLLKLFAGLAAWVSISLVLTGWSCWMHHGIPAMIVRLSVAFIAMDSRDRASYTALSLMAPWRRRSMIDKSVNKEWLVRVSTLVG